MNCSFWDSLNIGQRQSSFTSQNITCIPSPVDPRPDAVVHLAGADPDGVAVVFVVEQEPQQCPVLCLAVDDRQSVSLIHAPGRRFRVRHQKIVAARTLVEETPGAEAERLVVVVVRRVTAVERPRRLTDNKRR